MRPAVDVALRVAESRDPTRRTVLREDAVNRAYAHHGGQPACGPGDGTVSPPAGG